MKENTIYCGVEKRKAWEIKKSLQGKNPKVRFNKSSEVLNNRFKRQGRAKRINISSSQYSRSDSAGGKKQLGEGWFTLKCRTPLKGQAAESGPGEETECYSMEIEPKEWLRTPS